MSSSSEGVSGPGSACVVIVNWNGRDLLEACLDSVLSQDYSVAYEVVVVDNQSTDGSVEFIQRRYPSVRVIRSEQNNYAAANNFGASLSRSEFVVTLNTDTRVEPDWLRRGIEYAETDARIGLVGPLILFRGGRVNSTGIEPLEGFHWRDRDFDEEAASGFSAGEVYGVSGCSAFYRRACWEELGGLDEDFYMYYEDVDMSLRCRQAGWQVHFCPASVVHHEFNASISKREKEEKRDSDTALKDELGERNRLFVVARHFPDVLMEVLPESRFLLYQDEETVEQGLRLILRKWARPELTPEVARELEVLLRRLRLQVLDRETWARSSEFELVERDRSLRELRWHCETICMEHESERRTYLARVRRLEDRLHNRENTLNRAESEALELRGRIAEVRSTYEEQNRRATLELEKARDAYEAEIRHREQVIADLKGVLAERDLELEQLRRPQTTE